MVFAMIKQQNLYINVLNINIFKKSFSSCLSNFDEVEVFKLKEIESFFLI